MNKSFLDANYAWIWDTNTDAQNLASLDFCEQAFDAVGKKDEFVQKNAYTYSVISNVWMLMLRDKNLSYLEDTLSTVIRKQGLTAAIRLASEAADEIKHSGKTQIFPKLDPDQVLTALPILSFPKRFCPNGNAKLAGKAVKAFKDLQAELEKWELTDGNASMMENCFERMGLSDIFTSISTNLFKEEEDFLFMLFQHGGDNKSSRPSGIFEQTWSKTEGEILTSSGSCFFRTTDKAGSVHINSDVTSKDEALKVSYALRTDRFNMIKQRHDDTAVFIEAGTIGNIYVMQYRLDIVEIPVDYLRCTYGKIVKNDAKDAWWSESDLLGDSNDYNTELSIFEKPVFSSPNNASISEIKRRTFVFDIDSSELTAVKTVPYSLVQVFVPAFHCTEIIYTSEEIMGDHHYFDRVDCVLGMEVPKNYDKRRFICMSNPASMSDQLRAKQAYEKCIRSIFYHVLEDGRKVGCLTRQLMPSRKQEVNQMVAAFGARTGLYATFDFSSASDLITPWRQRIVLGEEALAFVQNHSPSHISYGGNSCDEMYSLAPMGVGETFENEKCFYFAVAEAAIELTIRENPKLVAHWRDEVDKALKCLRRDESENYHNIRHIVQGAFGTAMGDDVTLPSFAISNFEILCSMLGLKINSDKTFSKSNPAWTYRESCGKEYVSKYDALYDVSPVYWPRHEVDFSDLMAAHSKYNVKTSATELTLSIVSLTSLQHRLYAEYPLAQCYLANTICKNFPSMTFSRSDTECDDLWCETEVGPISYYVSHLADDGKLVTAYESADSVHPDDVITIDGEEVNKRIGHYVLACESSDYNVPKDLQSIQLANVEAEKYALDRSLLAGSHSVEVPYCDEMLEFYEPIDNFMSRKGKQPNPTYKIKF